MFRVYLIVLIILLSSCQNLNSSTSNSNDISDEAITDPVPFTDVPADTVPAEGKIEILSRLSLSGQSLGLTTAASLGINIGEAGRVNVSQANRNQWHTINLKDSYQDPIVIMQPLSYNAGDPSVVRIKAVTSNSFKFQITEWAYLNGAHGAEKLSYIVLEKGVWAFNGGLSLEVGSTSVNHNFKQVNLQLNFASNPVVLTQVQTHKDSEPVTTRQRPKGNGFQVRLQEEQAADGLHVNERVGYIAVSQGQERLGDIAITAGIKGNVTQNFKNINFGFIAPVENEKPIFLAGMQSYNGTDPAGLRYKNLTTSNVRVRVEEEKSADAETLHGAEDVGYLLLANIPPVVPAWTEQFGTSNFDVASAMVTKGNAIVVAGETWGSLAGNSAGIRDAYVRKYNSTGNVLWTKQFGTLSNDYASGVAVDSSKDVLVAGTTQGPLAGSSAGLNDAFVRKYDNLGNVLWTRQFGTLSNDFVHGIVVDSSKDVLVAGTTQGPLAGSSAGFYDAFVRKYDNLGNVLWTRQFGTNTYDSVEAVTVDKDDNVLVAGQTSGSIAGSNAGAMDAFLRKYDSLGNILWTKQFGTSDPDRAYTVVVDSSNNILVAGATAGILAESKVGGYDAFVRKYDSLGNVLWTKQFGTSLNDTVEGVVVDNSNNVLVVGQVLGSLIGNSLGSYDAFVRKYDGLGNILWTKQFGTKDSDTAKAVAVNNGNEVIVAGDTAGNLSGSNLGIFDVFVRKYTYP